MKLPPPRRHTLDDQGNAERLAYYYGQYMRHVSATGRWFLWNGKCWDRDRRGQYMRYGMKLSEAVKSELDLFLDGVTDPAERESVTAAVQAHAKKCRSRAAILNALALASALDPIAADMSDFDADPWVLNVWNGIIDLRTGALLEHNREAMCTKLAPTEYHPDREAPEWVRFSGWAAGEYAAFLRRYLGYCLTGVVSEQVMVICHGAGANGKSTMLGTVRHVLGDYAVVAAPKLLEDTGQEAHAANVADLDGARFVEVSENDRGRPMRESLVKTLTGDSVIKARFMNRDWFEFPPQFKLAYACNHVPLVRSMDHGIWRRLIFLPFESTAETPDTELPDRLKAEAEGVLAWLVQGCLEWQREGLGVPEELRRVADEVRQEADLIGQFIDDECVLNLDAMVSASGLYTAYSNWAKSNGYQPLNQTNFGRAMTERGHLPEKSGGKKWRRGLRLRVEEVVFARR